MPGPSCVMVILTPRPLHVRQVCNAPGGPPSLQHTRQLQLYYWYQIIYKRKGCHNSFTPIFLMHDRAGKISTYITEYIASQHQKENGF